MAAVKGKKGRSHNIHLLQEPQAGTRLPSTLSSAWSSGFLEWFSDWVGSFNSPSPFQRQGHDSDIILFFYVCAQVAPNCLSLFLCDCSRGGKKGAGYAKINEIRIDFMAERTLIYCEQRWTSLSWKELLKHLRSWQYSPGEKTKRGWRGLLSHGLALQCQYSIKWHGHSWETDPKSLETDFAFKMNHGWPGVIETDY